MSEIPYGVFIGIPYYMTGAGVVLIGISLFAIAIWLWRR